MSKQNKNTYNLTNGKNNNPFLPTLLNIIAPKIESYCLGDEETKGTQSTDQNNGNTDDDSGGDRYDIY